MNSFSNILLVDDSEIDNMTHTKIIQESRLVNQINIYLNDKATLHYLKEVVQQDCANLPALI